MTRYANWEEYANSPDYTFDQLAGSVVKIKFGDGTRYHRDADGDRYWFKNGQYHRDGDLLAEIWADGTQFWYKQGKLHRDGDLPSVIWANGSQFWYKQGKLHRDEDLPAEVWANGTRYWYKNGRKIEGK